MALRCVLRAPRPLPRCALPSLRGRASPSRASVRGVSRLAAAVRRGARGGSPFRRGTHIGARAEVRRRARRGPTAGTPGDRGGADPSSAPGRVGRAGATPRAAPPRARVQPGRGDRPSRRAGAPSRAAPAPPADPRRDAPWAHGCRPSAGDAGRLPGAPGGPRRHRAARGRRAYDGRDPGRLRASPLSARGPGDLCRHGDAGSCTPLISRACSPAHAPDFRKSTPKKNSAENAVDSMLRAVMSNSPPRFQ